MSAIHTFYRPKSIAEAVKILKENPAAAPLAGGTFMMLHAPKRITALVDLSHLALSYIKRRNSGVAIGAMTTFNQLARSSSVGALAEITANTATEPLRNMITVGGDVVIPFRWSDLPLIFCLLNATFVLKSPRARTLKADTFFSRQPRQTLKPGELLTEIVLPDMKPMRLARKKLVRAHDDVPGLHVAVALRMAGKKVEFVRVGCVGHKPLPMRLKETEAILRGKAPDSELIRLAAQQAEREVAGLKDIRYSSEYLREMVGVFTRRLIEECVGNG